MTPTGRGTSSARPWLGKTKKSGRGDHEIAPPARRHRFRGLLVLLVDPRPANEDVDARAAEERVGAVPAADRVATRAAGEAVIAVTAKDTVGPRAADHGRVVPDHDVP